jgi:hypothetical protein
VVPLQTMQAHLGDRRYSSYPFLTSVLEGGEWSASRPGRALPPDKEPPVPFVQEAGWAPEPVWKQRLQKKTSASVRDRTPAVQSVVRHYTDWATPAHDSSMGVRSIVKNVIFWSGYKMAPNMAQWRACVNLLTPQNGEFLDHLNDFLGKTVHLL